MVGYRIRQLRMVCLIGLTALLLAGTGWCGLGNSDACHRNRAP